MSISFSFSFLFLPFELETFGVNTCRKKGKSRIETRIVAQMSTSQGSAGTKNCTRLDFSFDRSEEEREKQKKRRREFTRLQSAQQSALVSAGVNDRRETGDLSCRLRAPVGGRTAFSEDAQKFPAWLLLLCCFAAAAAAHQFS
jgi:hypothetical protein